MNYILIITMGILGWIFGGNKTSGNENSSKDELFRKYYNQIETSIKSWENKDDIYAISIWITSIDDDPRMIQAIIGYNTLSQMNSTIKSASNPAEAKWNYAFWLQNEKVTVGGDDSKFQTWIKKSPEYYEDKLYKTDIDSALEKGNKIETKFVNEIISITQKLFKDGVIKSKFGKDIPVIIHELEYYDKPLNWTKRANPTGLVDEFENWVNRQ